MKGQPIRFIQGHPTRRPLPDRFWEKVDKSAGPDACWFWIGSISGGYGMIFRDGERIGAHRISWELHNGPIPPGLDVLHNCPGGDNPACVNPAHLFLGTHTDNMADMVAKGRHNAPHGEQCSSAKLTPAQVLEIRQLRTAGQTLKVIAAGFDVSLQAVHYIVTGRNWAHLAEAG